jgi:hypothetical protein
MDMQASTTLDLAMVEKSVHPRTLFHFTPPPPVHTHDDEGEESGEQDEDDE